MKCSIKSYHLESKMISQDGKIPHWSEVRQWPSTVPMALQCGDKATDHIWGVCVVAKINQKTVI